MPEYYVASRERGISSIVTGHCIGGRGSDWQLSVPYFLNDPIPFFFASIRRHELLLFLTSEFTF